MERQILTIAEAADYLQLGVRTLYSLAKEHKIPGRKVKNKYRFERESLRRWIAGEEHMPTSEQILEGLGEN